ncbi:MAG: M20/M25/M40 family metallo-hydrolase, partial [Planctomycetales bacterium]|nr:M20/M25/M40 family metallo-hydrolase [Planctomycetales bacterium]
LLLEWPGESPEMGAILLMSHFDVVPVEASTLEQWSQRPFGGQIDETYVWGRGTLDCKHGVMAILEAITLLHTAGFQPQRTIYVALGHDEELGGSEGNRKIAEWMRSRGLRLQMIVDEGGCIFTEFPGLDRPAALVGVAEKGYMTVKLSVDMEPSELGHASMPPRETAVSILATAVRRVQAHPFPARLDGPLREMLKFLGPEMPSLASRVAMSNLWLCGPLVKRRLGATPSGNALLRTTVAPTMIDGGVKPNVLPAHASATFNLRLLPGDSVDDALAHLQQAIGDARVQVHSLPPTTAASAVSPVDSPEFGQLQRTIGEVFPDVVVAPFVLVGSTDTVHYSDLCENIFRFIPTRLGERDTQRFHGINERLGRENYLEILRFFHRLLENVAGHR